MFSSFFVSLQKKFRLERWTITLELHYEVSQHIDAPQCTSMPCLMVRSPWPYHPQSFVSKIRIHSRPRTRHKAVVEATAGPFIRGISICKSQKWVVFFVTTNYKICVFAIVPDWVIHLWQCHKISEETARIQYVRAKRHVKSYLGNMDYQ